MYFDMPYEPDPEERGFYWATRFTETRNTFNYLPDSIYDNIEIDRFGRPQTKEEICNTQNCVELEDGKRSNVVGKSYQFHSFWILFSCINRVTTMMLVLNGTMLVSHDKWQKFEVAFDNSNCIHLAHIYHVRW